VENMNLVEKSTKFKFWTKLGLAKLGEIIRESRELKKITLRQAGEIVSEVSGMSINYRTINSIENAQGIPQFNTLVAMLHRGSLPAIEEFR
jgi:transcriptional regulator with XRE-family HTH domain